MKTTFCRSFVLSLATAILLSLALVSHASDPMPGLVGHWQFEEGAGLTTADSSGNGITGTLLSGPIWVPSPLGTNALEFDGINDGVDLGNPTSLQITGAITLTAWVYVDTISGAGRFIAKGGASGQRGWGLNVEANNTWAFQVAGNATTTVALNVPNVIIGQWVHVAGVYDNTAPSMKLYLYGTLVGERADIPTSQFASPVNAFIGRRASGTFFDGKLDEVRVFNRALSRAEIQALPELAPTPLTFVTQPVSRVVAQFRPVTFTSAVRGAPPHFFHWFSNDVAIPGATSPTYTIPSTTLDMTGSAFAVNVSNFVNSITSTNAILTVSDDTSLPVLVSVGSADGTNVGVCYSEMVDFTTATDPFDYEVRDSNGAALILNIVMRPDRRSVVLQLALPISGSFTSVVNYVKDLAGNEIAVNSTATGIVAGLMAGDINAPGVPGSIFSCKDGDFDVVAGGDDIWDESDQAYVALKAVSGDFDVKVRVQSLSPANDISKAGLMVRQTIDPGSPTLHLLANPPPPAGRGWIEAGRRTIAAGATTSWGTNFTAAVMPNVWLRLRRTGDFFAGFYSVNGSEWVIMATASQVFGDPVLVGLAATARNNATSTVAEFREFGDMQFSNPTLNITQQPASTSAPQNSTVTFNVQAAGTGAPANELAYQWQRDFINIPGANSASLSVFARPPDDGAQFSVRVYLAGLVVDSDVATLTLTPDVTPPTIQSVTAPGQGNQVIVRFSEEVAASAADTFKYAIVEAVSGTPVSMIAAVLGPDGRSVLITTPVLQESTAYRITVNDIQDLGEPPNTIAPNSEAQFQYDSLLAYWQFEEGAGLTTTDISGNGITGTLLNGALWTPGLFGRYALEFDGADDRIDAGNPAALNLTGSMTVAAWVYVESITDNGRIVTKGGGPGQRGWSLNVEGIDVWAFQIAISGSANISLNVPGIPIRRWTHVAGVYDTTGPEGEGPEMRLYTNGVLGGISRSGVPSSQFNSPLNVSIGGRPINATFFDGRIDEVRIHARALNENEIAQIARPRLLTATLSGGQIRLDWAGAGRLEATPALNAAWLPIAPQPVPPYLDTLVPGENRFYRLNSTPTP